MVIFFHSREYEMARKSTLDHTKMFRNIHKFGYVQNKIACMAPIYIINYNDLYVIENITSFITP